MKEDIIYRQAKPEEIDKIIEFLRINFPERKLYHENRDFFQKEFLSGQTVNIWIARNQKEILAICSYYLANERENPDMISGIWSAKKDKHGLVGMTLRKKMLNFYQPNQFAGTTMLESSLVAHRYFTRVIREFNGWEAQVGAEQIEKEYKLDKTPNESKLESVFGRINQNNGIHKEMKYLLTRYWHNPKINYFIYHLAGEQEVILICRYGRKDEISFLELVDIIGSDLNWKVILEELSYVAREMKCQKVLFYELGFSEEALLEAGFSKIEQNSKQLRYAFANKNICMTIGDGIVEEVDVINAINYNRWKGNKNE